jgi:hypothetical protein
MSTQENKAFNLYDLLDKARPYLRPVARRWYVALIIGLLFGLLGYYQESQKPTNYTAQITYMLEDEILGSGQSAGNPLMAAISGQSTSTSSKIIMNDLAASNKLIELTLMRQVEIDKKTILLVNYYQEKFGYVGKGNIKDAFWFRDTYNIGSNQALDTRLRSLSSSLKLSLKAKVLESGLLKMELSSGDEKFTKFFLEQHLKTISDFYINKRIEKAQNAVVGIKRRKDSLSAVIQGKEFTAASILDNSFGAVMRRAQVPEIQVRKDLTVLNAQYLESITALNAAKSELEKRRPFISVVDDIRYPLASTGPKAMNTGIIYSLVGLLIGALLLAGKEFSAEFLKKQKQEYSEALKNQA